MADYKKNTDHLTNAALAAPIILATGNIPAAIVALGLGKALDMAEDKDFDERRKNWAKNPDKGCMKVARNWTKEELDRIKRKNDYARSIIQELPAFKNASRISRTVDLKHKNNQYITFGDCAGIPVGGVRDGKIVFHDGYFDFNGSIKKPARLYREISDFLKQYNNDQQRYPHIQIYGLPLSCLGIDHASLPTEWMYTVDNGETYVAVTNGCV